MVRSGEAFALPLILQNGAGENQDLLGRSFVLSVRLSRAGEPFLEVAGVLAGDHLSVSFIVSADDATAVYEAGLSRALQGDITEVGGTFRHSFPVTVDEGSGVAIEEPLSLPNFPVTELVAMPGAVIVIQRGAQGYGAERRLYDAGLIDEPTIAAMDARYALAGALKGFPFGAVSAVAAAEVPVSVGFIQTAYHTSPVWGGGATYRRCAVGEDILPGEITSADGARWTLRMPMVSPQMFGAAGVGDVANMAIDTHGCQMAADYYAATGIATQADNSTYIVDGYKGDRETWSAGIWAHGGIVITNGWKVYGNGATFKNGADNFRSVIRVRGGDTHFENITIDGDFPNRTEIPYDGSTNANFGVVRGCVLIYEGASSAEKRASIKNVALKNSGGYLFGIENIKAQNVSIENIYFENAGADCLDIKAYSTPDFPKAGNITGVYCGDGCGHNFSAVGEEGGRNDQAVLDIGGIFNVSNVLIEGLDSDPGSLGNTGVRFRSLIASENRLGAQGSTLTNAKVVSSKLANEGSETAKRIVGFAVNCSDVSIANVETRGCFYGALVGISGNPSNTDLYDVSIANAVFKDSTGENISDATAGVGLRVGAAARGFSGSNIHVKGGDHGLRLDGSGGAFSGLLIRDTDLAVRAASNIWRNYSISGLQLVNNVADTDGLSELSDSTGVTAKKHTIVADRQVFADFVSLANDSAWTGDNAWLGGQRYYTREDSHVAGEVGRVGFLASGAAGSGFYYDMAIKGSTILRLREDKASFLKDVSIEGGRQLWTTYQSSANDSGWSGDNAWLGGQRYYTADTSTPGEVIRVGALATGAAGSDFIYAIRHSDQIIADFRSDRMHINKPFALLSITSASVPTADAGRVMFFSDSADGLLKTKDSAGVVHTYALDSDVAALGDEIQATKLFPTSDYTPGDDATSFLQAVADAARDAGKPWSLRAGVTYTVLGEVTTYTDLDLNGGVIETTNAGQTVNLIKIEPHPDDVEAVALTIANTWTLAKGSAYIPELAGQRGWTYTIDGGDMNIRRSDGSIIRQGQTFTVVSDEGHISEPLHVAFTQPFHASTIITRQRNRPTITIENLAISVTESSGSDPRAAPVNIRRCNVVLKNISIFNNGVLQMRQGFSADNCENLVLENCSVDGLHVDQTNYAFNSNLTTGVTFINFRERGCRRGIDGNKSANYRIIGGNIPDGVGGHWLHGLYLSGEPHIGCFSGNNPGCITLAGGDVIGDAIFYLGGNGATVLRNRSDIMELSGVVDIGGLAILDNSGNQIGGRSTPEARIIDLSQKYGASYDTGRTIEWPSTVDITRLSLRLIGAQNFSIPLLLYGFDSNLMAQDVRYEGTIRVKPRLENIPPTITSGAKAGEETIRVNYTIPPKATGGGCDVEVDGIPVPRMTFSGQSTSHPGEARAKLTVRNARPGAITTTYGAVKDVALINCAPPASVDVTSSGTRVGDEDLRWFASAERPPAANIAASRIFLPDAHGPNTATVTIVPNQLYVFAMSATLDINALMMEVVTGDTGNIRSFLYSASPTRGRSYLLIEEANEVGHSTAGFKTMVLAGTRRLRGPCFVGFICSGAPIVRATSVNAQMANQIYGRTTLNTNTADSHLIAALTYGTLPVSCPPLSASNATAPAIAVRTA